MNTQTTTTPKKSEGDIKTKIKDDLEAKGWIVIMLIVSNKDGHPDMLALSAGARIVFIEVKKMGGYLSQIQKFRHEQLRKKGFEVIVARDVEDIRHLVS